MDAYSRTGAQERFQIRVDTSDCTSLITGYDARIKDTWFYSCRCFESGKIYGLVSEYGQGCMYLSYLLGGMTDLGKVKVFFNDRPITQSELRGMSHCLEPYGKPYGKKKVRPAIEKALSANSSPESFRTVADRFMLTPERYGCTFNDLSGERWRASAALGHAQNKKIFFAPYKTSEFYRQMCRSGMLTALRELTKNGAVVVLPAGSDSFIKHIADEVMYLDPEYDTDSLKAIIPNSN